MSELWGVFCGFTESEFWPSPHYALLDTVLYWPWYIESLKHFHRGNVYFAYKFHNVCLYTLFTVRFAWWNWCELCSGIPYHSKPEVVKEPALSSLAAPWVVKTTTSGAATGVSVCIVTVLGSSVCQRLFMLQTTFVVAIVRAFSFYISEMRISNWVIWCH